MASSRLRPEGDAGAVRSACTAWCKGFFPTTGALSSGEAAVSAESLTWARLVAGRRARSVLLALGSIGAKNSGEALMRVSERRGANEDRDRTSRIANDERNLLVGRSDGKVSVMNVYPAIQPTLASKNKTLPLLGCPQSSQQISANSFVQSSISPTWSIGFNVIRDEYSAQVGMVQC